MTQPYYQNGDKALRNDRKFIGIELDADYCEVARKRIDGERKKRRLF